MSWIVGAGSTAFASAATYLVARRQHSGTVATTDADRLWAQNDKLIDAYAKDNEHQRSVIESLRSTVTEQDRRIWEMAQRERECNEKNFHLEKKMERLERMLKVDISASTEAEIGGL